MRQKITFHYLSFIAITFALVASVNINTVEARIFKKKTSSSSGSSKPAEKKNIFQKVGGAVKSAGQAVGKGAVGGVKSVGSGVGKVGGGIGKGIGIVSGGIGRGIGKIGGGIGRGAGGPRPTDEEAPGYEDDQYAASEEESYGDDMQEGAYSSAQAQAQAQVQQAMQIKNMRYQNQLANKNAAANQCAAQGGTFYMNKCQFGVAKQFGRGAQGRGMAGGIGMRGNTAVSPIGMNDGVNSRAASNSSYQVYAQQRSMAVRKPASVSRFAQPKPQPQAMELEGESEEEYEE